MRFTVLIKNCAGLKGLQLGLILTNQRRQRVVAFQSNYNSNLVFSGAAELKLVCDVPRIPLIPGTYDIDVVLAGPSGSSSVSNKPPNSM